MTPGRPDQRAEPRIAVTRAATLSQDGRSAPCVIRNMCSRGFLIQSDTALPVGRDVHLRAELYPGCAVECLVQVRHVNRNSLGARVVQFFGDAETLCRRFLREQSAGGLAA